MNKANNSWFVILLCSMFLIYFKRCRLGGEPVCFYSPKPVQNQPWWSYKDPSRLKPVYVWTSLTKDETSRELVKPTGLVFSPFKPIRSLTPSRVGYRDQLTKRLSVASTSLFEWPADWCRVYINLKRAHKNTKWSSSIFHFFLFKTTKLASTEIDLPNSEIETPLTNALSIITQF